MLKKWYFWVALVAVLFLTAGLFVCYQLFFASPWVITGSGTQIDEPEVIAKPPVDPLKPIYVLLLGYGGANHAGGGLADTIMLAQIIPREKEVNLYSLPRDLWVKLPFNASEASDKDFRTKLNATLAIGNSVNQYTWRPEIFKGQNGGGELAKTVVSEIVGQPIDYYAAVDFDGFKKAIELLAGKDGLKVNVPYSFSDEFYPIAGKEDDPCDFNEEEIKILTETLKGYELEQQFQCRYETLTFQKGEQVIGADELLKFARSRHSGTGGGDFGRSQRQQAVLEAVKTKVFSVGIIPKIPDLLGQSFKIVKTDLDLDFIKKALLDYGNLQDFVLASYVIDNKSLLKDGRSNDGQYILYPVAGEDNYIQIQELIASGSAIPNL